MLSIHAVARITAVALAGVSVVTGASQVSSAGACPGNIYADGGSLVCHLVSGTTCKTCKYSCSDGQYWTVDWCGREN
mgnify:CR=1 FL=1